MRDQIDLIIRDHLEPYLERLEALNAEIEELRRRQHLMIRLGYVSQIHDSKRLIKVKHGELETPFIKWFAQAAGRVSCYRCPSQSEQVLLLNFGAGDNSAQSIALVGISSLSFPLPSGDPDQVVTVYGDDCAAIWNMKAGTLTLKASQAINLEAPLVHVQGDIQADGDIRDYKRSMAEDRAIYNKHNHYHGEPKTSQPEQQQ